MREVEFRGKSKLIGKWVYGNLIVKKTKRQIETLEEKLYDYKYSIQRLNKSEKYTSTEVIEESVGQYTGLKDKNGKEIYEGDIVYIIPEVERGTIVWDKETARYIVASYNIITDLDNWYGRDLEVIGNIYDNPELLAEKE